MEVFPKTSCIASETLMEHDSEVQIQQIKEVTSNLSQLVLKDKVESGACNLQQELLDTKPFDHSSSNKTDLESELPWGSNKFEPWWRVSDKEELASFVAQKSLENIENCDLPRPTHICRNPFACTEIWDGNRIFSSFGCNVDTGMYPSIAYPKHNSGFREMEGKYWHLDHAYIPPFATENFSSNANQSRTQLLEALRLSQSRARNAEIAAQKACDEKEHIIKLLLKQASHLFACKQWMRILQLESLFLRLRTENRPIASVFPVLPWTPLRAKGGDESRRKGKKKKKKKQKRCRWCRYAFLLAVGLGLAGAGLFLGCCLGWLSPTTF